MPLFTVRLLAVKPHVLIENGDTTMQPHKDWEVFIECVNADDEACAINAVTARYIRQDYESLLLKTSSQGYWERAEAKQKEEKLLRELQFLRQGVKLAQANEKIARLELKAIAKK